MSKWKIGFGRERNGEEELEYGLGYLLSQVVDIDKEPYPHYLGDWVKIQKHGRTAGIGVYRGLRTFNGTSELILLPTAITRITINPYSDNPTNKTTYLELVCKPSHISFSDVDINWLGEDYIKGCINESQTILGMKIIPATRGMPKLNQ